MTLDSSNPQLPDGYILHIGPPSLDDYMDIRRTAGYVTPVGEAQACAALLGSWYCIHITHESDPNKAIAMGRIVGDGGWYFSIADIAMLLEHQRKGIGQFIMNVLMERIDEVAPSEGPGVLVTLMASSIGKGLYEKFGFSDWTPKIVGMGQWYKKGDRIITTQ
jgi:GNAT superfamily N-acetyltransferase